MMPLYSMTSSHSFLLVVLIVLTERPLRAEVTCCAFKAPPINTFHTNRLCQKFSTSVVSLNHQLSFEVHVKASKLIN